MSVQNITRRAGPYVGTGLVSAYTFAFKVFRPEDVKVVRSESADASAQDEALKFGTDYTVKLNANQDEKAGGTVTLVSPLAEGLRLSILSAITPDQQMVLTNHDGFLPTTLNESADKAIALIQELQELLGRGITVPATSGKAPEELFEELLSAAKNAQLSAEEAQRFAEICEEIKQNIFIYSWDIPHVVDTLDDVEKYPFDGFFAVGGYGDPGHHGQDISNRVVKASGSTELRTLGEWASDVAKAKEKLSSVINVKDFGAKGDGVTDDTAAFEAALDKANRREALYVPAGTYVLSRDVAGSFVSFGDVRTNRNIDVLDINSLKTRKFVETLNPGMLFTIPIPRESANSHFFLQGYCIDDADNVYVCMRTSSHSAQKIMRFNITTGESLTKDFTNLYHVNAATFANGKLYVCPMNTSLAPIVELDPSTLTVTRNIPLASPIPGGGGALAYDKYTNRFYYYANATVWVLDTDFQLVKSIKWTYPDWTPPVGQAYGAYKGMLFFARSASDTFVARRYEAVLVFDTDKCKVVYEWIIGGSFGELESVAFYKNRMLLGFNDGPAEIPFYLATFDKSARLKLPLTTEELVQKNHPYFGNLSQETVTLYVDADATAPGEGSESKPFNSLKRAIWCAQQVQYRSILKLKGDFTRTSDRQYIQGVPRMIDIEPWGADYAATIPPLIIVESTVRIGAVIVKGAILYSDFVCCIYSENSSLDVRMAKFDPTGFSGTIARYIHLLRGEFFASGIDFSLTASHLPTAAYVSGYSGASIALLGNMASFIYPPEAEKVVRFTSVGTCTSQFADARGLIQGNAYSVVKLGQVYQGDGLGNLIPAS